MRAPTLALADVHHVTTDVAGRTVDLFIFDHHRTAFTLWAHTAATLGRPLTLVTLDRHMDLGTPPAMAPDHRVGLEALDHFARHQLAPSNDDHIVAALESQAISNAVIVARSHAPPSLEVFRPYRDARGGRHEFVFAKAVAAVDEAALAVIEESEAVVLDIDLDCFTTRSDGHPDEVLCWDADRIASFLKPLGSERFWSAVLARTVVVTIAREPYHCGGFERAARLWGAFSEVFFGRVLGVPAP